MIQRLTGPLSIVLLVALSATRADAEAARSGDPFADLDSMNLSIEVGGPLDVHGGTARQLFVGDLKRFNRFREEKSRSRCSDASRSSSKLRRATST
jgi:hypothetical protein